MQRSLSGGFLIEDAALLDANARNMHMCMHMYMHMHMDMCMPKIFCLQYVSMQTVEVCDEYHTPYMVTTLIW